MLDSEEHRALLRLSEDMHWLRMGIQIAVAQAEGGADNFDHPLARLLKPMANASQPSTISKAEEAS